MLKLGANTKYFSGIYILGKILLFFLHYWKKEKTILILLL
jgi:hypothetical protein